MCGAFEVDFCECGSHGVKVGSCWSMFLIAKTVIGCHSFISCNRKCCKIEYLFVFVGFSCFFAAKD